jgi:S-adenosylmethionine:tRNA-ribosyltransferase-isomerase (queuine synthetase)
VRSKARSQERQARARVRPDLRPGPDSKLQIVSGILTGMHSPAESHYALLGAFVPDELLLLRQAFDHTERQQFIAHEFGGSTLVTAHEVNGLSHAA